MPLREDIIKRDKNYNICLFNFEITSYCNAKCPSCHRTLFNDTVNLKHLKVEDFEMMILNNVKYLKHNLYDRIHAKFCGELGDPLLNPDVEELIFIADNVFNKVEIHTNGGLRSSTWIRNILKRTSKRTVFIFGIDGLSNDVNQIYRVNVNTKLALKNMIESSKHRTTKWEYTIFSHNYHELNSVIDLSKKYDIDLLCRFNGRQFNKIQDAHLNNCINELEKNNIKYYVCK